MLNITMHNIIMLDTRDLATSSEKKSKEFIALEGQYNTQNKVGHGHSAILSIQSPVAHVVIIILSNLNWLNVHYFLN